MSSNASNKENLSIVEYYLRKHISLREARKEMNESQKKELSTVSGWMRQNTKEVNILFHEPLINVIWKFYHFEPMAGSRHISGLISQFVSFE